MCFLNLGSSPFVPTFGYTCLALGYGCLLLAFVTIEPGEGRLGRAMGSRPAGVLAWVGLWSYSIYLWHVELSVLVGALAGRAGSGVPRDVWVAMYLAASVGLGVVMGRLIERPFLALRDRLFPSRTGAPAFGASAVGAQAPAVRPALGLQAARGGEVLG
jgi:peptidoglycan/LPS O-acetylase OafA/YrhL